MSVANKSGQQSATYKSKPGRSIQNAQREFSEVSCVKGTTEHCGLLWLAVAVQGHFQEPRHNADLNSLSGEGVCWEASG